MQKPYSRLPAALCFTAIGVLAACSPAATPTAAVLIPTTAAAATAVTQSTLPAVPEATATLEPMPTETSAPSATAADFPDPAGYAWVEAAGGLQKPTALVDPQDGSGRLLILEQSGRIRWIENSQVLEQPFLDIRAKIAIGGSEQGLLGIALDPQYAENGTFYLDYTDLNGNTVIARYQRGADPLQAEAESEQVLLTIAQPYANHNGGQLAFGPDGYLYIGMGDGGSAGDPHNNAQNPAQLLGKILRIAVRGEETYSIPPDNPYAAGGGAQEVWALGLRNPWRFSFDRQSGDLYVADVGQNLYEELNLISAGQQRPGLNFGWDYYEGQHAYDERVSLDPSTLVWPVFEYAHDQGCSITGGYVYRGTQLPEWNGIFLFGDYCSGLVWGALQQADGAYRTQQLFQIGGNLSAFGQDAYGEVYALDYLNGQVLKLAPAP